MRGVLIVDDEPLVRVTLRSTVRWERYGFACVAEAANGGEALRALRAHPETALVMLDLAMPGMDGLELLRQIRAQEGQAPERQAPERQAPERQLQIIVLSAHDEFSMVREAFTLGVNDYLLKSELDSGRLDELLAAAARRLDADGLRTDAERRIDRTDAERRIDRTDAERRIDRTDTTKPSPVPPASSHGAAMKQDLLSRLLATDEPSALRPEMEAWGVRVGPVLCLGLLTVCEYEVVAARYDQSTRTTFPLGLLAVVEQVLGRLPLGEVIRTADDEYVLFLSFAERHSDSRIEAGCQAVCADITRALASYLNVTVTIALSAVTELGTGPAPSDLYRALSAGRTGPSRLTVRAREYILKHHHESDLRLQGLSEHLGVTPNYLSALFHRETGKSFREYLALVRVEAAKRLLAGSSLRIREVGEMVGYVNIEHFSRVFKKLTGVPPHLFAGSTSGPPPPGS
jgi:CheY-like chemotaxis protein/AraC-like DNA-binding protein